MSRSSDSGATEPLAALVAVFAVSVGLAVYAGVLDDAFGRIDDERNWATPTGDTVEKRLSKAGVVDPERMGEALDAVPTGYRGNVTVTADTRWCVGPVPPSNPDTDTRTVSVRLGPGAVRRGTLTVRVWR